MPVKLFFGNDEYSINNELKKLRKTILNANFSDLNRKVITEKPPSVLNLKDIVELVETTPMMFGNLLIEINATSLFLRGKTTDEVYTNRLINNLKDLSETTYVFFVCIFPKDSDKKPDSAKKLYKTIKEVGEIKEYNVFKFYDTDKYIDWIMKTAKSKKLVLSSQNAKLLFSLAGNDFRTLDSELEKLKTYILPSSEISQEDIIRLSQNNEDAFAILELWLNNDKYKMLEELDKLMQKDAPQKIIALFQTMVKKWLRIKLEAQYSNSDEIAKIIGAHPFYVKNELNRLKSVSTDDLLQLRKLLNKAEFQMKSGEIKPETALEMALVS